MPRSPMGRANSVKETWVQSLGGDEGKVQEKKQAYDRRDSRICCAGLRRIDVRVPFLQGVVAWTGLSGGAGTNPETSPHRADVKRDVGRHVP